MQKFEGKLEVGGLAIVIGCRWSENSWAIGKVVELHAATPVGGRVSCKYTRNRKSFHNQLDSDGWVIYIDGHRGSLMNDGFALIESKYLMPIPPLSDNELETEQEIPEAHA